VLSNEWLEQLFVLSAAEPLVPMCTGWNRGWKAHGALGQPREKLLGAGGPMWIRVPTRAWSVVQPPEAGRQRQKRPKQPYFRIRLGVICPGFIFAVIRPDSGTSCSAEQHKHSLLIPRPQSLFHLAISSERRSAANKIALSVGQLNQRNVAVGQI